ncbi:CND05990-like protein [Papiliotrema laurentii]|uniref:CND05990-like protein n=1 Tax=Papiliotrema laurentii TaxID=5418 RepID=A0AAD9FN95_PAPLA|nr:CND05990-like protein [Papiliotrema laurentii]
MYTVNTISLTRRVADSRRKNRCSKQIPCDVCVKRQVPHLCRLEEVFKTSDAATAPLLPAPPSPSDFAAFAQRMHSEMYALKTRIDALESGVLVGSKRRRMDSEEARYGRRSILIAATTLEFLALGIDRRLGNSAWEGDERVQRASLALYPDDASSRKHILAGPAERPLPESIRDALLPRANVNAILRFAEGHGLWQHCCVFFPRFFREVERFWETIQQDDTWAAVDPTWVALLYTLLGIAVHQMSPEQAAACGLSEADRLVLPNASVSAAEDALHHGQFLSRPTIWTVQVIAMLAMCGHNVCESDLLSSLLVIGIKTAQTLKLHTLGGQAKLLEGSDVELGKRLWWALAQEDWFGIPFRGVWFVHQDQFDTPMPSNCHDHDLVEGKAMDRPTAELTVAFKQCFSSQVSIIVRDTFSQLPHDSVSKVRSLLDSLPHALQSTRTRSNHLAEPKPPWADAMRHYLSISAMHKIIVIFRAALARGGSVSDRALAQAACVGAAESIVDELEQGGREEIVMQSLWTIPYHGLAAAVVLILDLPSVSSDALVLQRRQRVQTAKAALERLSPTSRIARRGLQASWLVRGGVICREPDRIGPVRLAERGRRCHQRPKRGPFSRNGTSCEQYQAVRRSRDKALSHRPLNQMMGGDDVSAAGLNPEGDVPQPIDAFDLNEDYTEQLLRGLQMSVPDVGRLFDGFLGTFDCNGMV